MSGVIRKKGRLDIGENNNIGGIGGVCKNVNELNKFLNDVSKVIVLVFYCPVTTTTKLVS